MTYFVHLGHKLVQRTASLLLPAALVFAFTMNATAEVRLSMSDALKTAVRKPTPPYNPIAKQMRVTGDVEVEVTINKQGDVENVKAVSGNAMLSGPVLRTVKEWKFTPPAEETITTLKFTFKVD